MMGYHTENTYLTAYHASEEPDLMSCLVPGLHVGTREQALTFKRPFLYLVTFDATKVVRTHDRQGDWYSYRCRSPVAVYLNRYEGIDWKTTGPVMCWDFLPDSQFRKRVPSAQDSYYINYRRAVLTARIVEEFDW
jgi:hypothetical protein